MLQDLEIAQKSEIRHIAEIAENVGIDKQYLEIYGKYKAKVSLEILRKLEMRKNGKYIDVTAITPTPLGEGKTVTTIGLSQAIGKIGKSVFTCIRQPSLGPVFGIKGGAAGGGYSQVIPMEDFNLHLTGDVHAVGLAHNLLAAFIDNSLFKKNPLSIDPFSISWPRVIDVSDRALRNIVIGLGGSENGIPRETGFDITVASEVMAILALAEDLLDMRKRLGKIIVARNKDKKFVTAEDLKASGAMAVLLRDAVKPTLMQTIEHTLVFVHAGPFANIAIGQSSIIADRIGLKMFDYHVTESGFAADIGFEKFWNVKCRISGLKPNVAVITCTTRALKMHGGGPRVAPGLHLPEEYKKEDLLLLEKGLPNLLHHIRTVKMSGIKPVVCINAFYSDTKDEIALIRRYAEKEGARVAFSEHWLKGGDGALELADAVIDACNEHVGFQFLYPIEMPLRQRVEVIAKSVYGADGVLWIPEAEAKAKRIESDPEKKDYYTMMVKTHLSLSHEPDEKGVPKGWVLPVRDILVYTGAKFLCPVAGTISLMPGTSSDPAFRKIDIDVDTRKVKGLF